MHRSAKRTLAQYAHESATTPTAPSPPHQPNQPYEIARHDLLRRCQLSKPGRLRSTVPTAHTRIDFASHASRKQYAEFPLVSYRASLLSSQFGSSPQCVGLHTRPGVSSLEYSSRTPRLLHVRTCHGDHRSLPRFARPCRPPAYRSVNVATEPGPGQYADIATTDPLSPSGLQIWNATRLSLSTQEKAPNALSPLARTTRVFA